MKPLTILIIVAFSALLLVGSVFLTKTNRQTADWHTNSAGSVHKLTVYKSATCGCCAIHADYLKKLGYKVEVIDVGNIDAVKQQYDIAPETLSCHTTIVNDGQYYIEGHIPKEPIAKLLEEEPQLKGIGMPGMPSGSPGMPGRKLAPFEIMQVDQDGQVSSYMNI
jgi:hypothetical protein